MQIVLLRGRFHQGREKYATLQLQLRGDAVLSTRSSPLAGPVPRLSHFRDRPHPVDPFDGPACFPLAAGRFVRNQAAPSPVRSPALHMTRAQHDWRCARRMTCDASRGAAEYPMFPD